MDGRAGHSLEDINFGDLGDIFNDPLLDDLTQYGELNPAFRFWEPDRRWDPSMVLEFRQIFFDKEKREREEREVNRRLELFRIAISSKINQLLNNPIWAQKGGSTTAGFRAAPRTFLKTIQEVLTAPTERMVFARDEIGGQEQSQGHPGAQTSDKTSAAEENTALEHIIIDPRRISDTLLRNLGLDEFIPKKGLKQEEQLKHRAEAVPKIRDMLTGLAPVKLPTQRTRDLNYFRLMRIGQGSNTGYVIGTQNIEGRKRLFKTDLYGAKRRLVHIEAGYHEEIRKLKWIEATLTDIRDRLQDWGGLKGTEELEELKQALLRCAQSLQFVRDQDKRDMLGKIRRFTDLRDSKGRNNPGKVAAEITYTLRRLKTRFERIERIWKYIGQDKNRVTHMICDEERPLNSFLEEVERLHERFIILRQGFTLTPEKKTKIIANLSAIRAEAQKLKYEPQLSFGRKFSAQTQAVIDHLEQDKNQAAAKEFIKMYLITKLTRAHNQLQEIYKIISLNSDGVDPRTLLGQLDGIQAQLKAHLVAAGIRTGEYDTAYGQVYHLLNSLKKRLRELLGAQEGQAPPGLSIRSRGINTVAAIVEEAISRVPAIRDIMIRIRNYIPRNFKPDQIKPAQRVEYTIEEKTATFAMMKKRIGEFDFGGLVSGLP